MWLVIRFWIDLDKSQWWLLIVAICSILNSLFAFVFVLLIVYYLINIKINTKQFPSSFIFLMANRPLYSWLMPHANRSIVIQQRSEIMNEMRYQFNSNRFNNFNHSNDLIKYNESTLSKIYWSLKSNVFRVPQPVEKILFMLMQWLWFWFCQTQKPENNYFIRFDFCSEIRMF